MILFRFVNSVMDSSLDFDSIWSLLKKLRLEFFKKNSDLINNYHKCKSLIPLKLMIENLEIMAPLLGVKSSKEINRNFSKNDINIGAEMFLFLNACPSFNDKLYWKAIYGSNSRIARLASNIINKANDYFKIKAIKIFAKISHVLGFQHISFKGKESFGKNIELKKNALEMNVTDKKLLQTVYNHPVHILNNEEEFSPSSFIPFCSFGKDFIGAKVDQFDIPVCNIFKPRIYFDQYCYETDLQELKSSNIKRLENQLEIGLTLVIDYNEERQINYNVSLKDVKKSLHHLDESVSIYLDTISITFYH